MKKRRPAFTLLEMIIVMSLIVIVLGIISSIFITGNKVFSDSDVRSTLQVEAQTIQEKISNIGMQGAEVVSPELNPEVNGINSLVIKSYVKEDDNPRYFKIRKSGNELIINEDTDVNCEKSENDQRISRYVESLGVGYNSRSNLIEFNIVLKKKNVEYPINFTISFRNEGK